MKEKVLGFIAVATWIAFFILLIGALAIQFYKDFLN
jgi:hypothetical protein